MTAADRTLHAIDATLAATEEPMPTHPIADRIPLRSDAGLPTVEQLRRHNYTA
ncbi:hypothetical protein [Micromonospora sp. WMMD980]|uniref:hypothetical protein n=1 Tax=Micromonospora sp. WMMD980 TaxID=3016088 RepID=UPI00241666A2|nr:hypothetical protein [Micromonospora sp. WMMD980]MDG4799034.1 hypothetical protein [Micromonospora sp. WMMD980]